MPAIVSSVGQSRASRFHFRSSSKFARHQITESMPYRFDIFHSSAAHHACTETHRPSCTRDQFVPKKQIAWEWPGKGEESMKEEPPVKIQTDKSRKYFGVVNSERPFGCAARRWYLSSFLFLWHYSERIYTYRLDTVQREETLMPNDLATLETQRSKLLE